MEKYVVKIEMREPISTSEAKNKYGTKADMNQDTYARGNVYSFGYTNDIAMAKSFKSYSDAENYAHSCMFNYWGKKSTIAKVVKCEVVMKPLTTYDVPLTTMNKLSLLLEEGVENISFYDGEIEKFKKENERWAYAMSLYERYIEKYGK